jgi:hypothetical protein
MANMLNGIIELLKPNVSIEAKLSGVGLYFGNLFDKFNDRLIELELRQLQKGDKGDKGDKGLDGKNGKDGKDGKNGIGRDGKDGKDGVDGKDGIDGVSITDTYVDIDGHLTVKLSNGNEIDAGKLSGSGTEGYVVNTQVARQQITVSTTAPTQPQVNDLWFNPQG